MKIFSMEESSAGSVEYYVLRCGKCGNTFRHDVTLGSFGKRIKVRMCLVCGDKVPIDDKHCLDHDPMNGRYDADFKSAKDL